MKSTGEARRRDVPLFFLTFPLSIFYGLAFSFLLLFTPSVYQDSFGNLASTFDFRTLFLIVQSHTAGNEPGRLPQLLQLLAQ